MLNQTERRWHFIYIIRNRITSKIYIGQSVDVRNRWFRHRKEVLRQTHPSALYDAIRKYGRDSFDIKIVDVRLGQAAADAAERDWIAKTSSTSREYGYNMLTGGNVASGPANPRFGKPLTEEHKRRISESNRGQKRSDEYRQRRRDAMRGKPAPVISKEGRLKAVATRRSKGNYRTPTPEHIRKMADGRIAARVARELSKPAIDPAFIQERKRLRSVAQSERNKNNTYSAKLREEDVREIRRMVAEKAGRRNIMTRFRVSQSQITMIASRQSWAWLT